MPITFETQKLQQLAAKRWCTRLGHVHLADKGICCIRSQSVRYVLINNHIEVGQYDVDGSIVFKHPSEIFQYADRLILVHVFEEV